MTDADTIRWALGLTPADLPTDGDGRLPLAPGFTLVDVSVQ